MKQLLFWFLRLVFRFRAYNTGVLGEKGPVLLIPNHVSWLDWAFLAAVLDDDWKFVTSSVTAQTSWFHRKMMINDRTFPIDTASPYAVKRMAEHLATGGRLVLFAEGRISMTGTLMKLFDGTGFLISKTRARVITCHLRGANRLRWVRHSGWTRWFPKVTAHFSPVLEAPETGHLSTAQARTRMTAWLRDRMMDQQFQAEMEFGPVNLPDAIAEMARVRGGMVILEDANRQELTYRKFLMGSDLLCGALARRIGPRRSPGAEGNRVGILLPNVNATPVVLMALWQLGRVPAVFNFSTGAATMLACARLGGIQQIITSKLFLEKARLSVQPFVDAGHEIIYLEDLRATIGGLERAAAAVRVLAGGVPGTGLRGDDAAVVLFTSGSEGVPKGVELSHGNVLANIRQMLAVTDLQDSDRVFNCLPLFHSFGLTVGTLLPLVRGMYCFIYPSPLHYRVIPAVFYDRDCTVFLSTNTFLNGYARKGHPYDFRSMRYLFAAAEKLQQTTATTWAERFGVRILEGYGATECSPCVAVNTPLSPRHGSVGRLLPGMEYRLEPVEGVEQGGRLLVRGPNLMKSYLNADANAKFKALEGWYDTGDIVAVDDDGYLSIKGRLKRFAKISGEMVSLTAVEEALAGGFPQFGLRFQVAVVTRPDPDKGEVLIVVSNEPKLTLEEVRAVIKTKGMTNLCVPREIRALREIPKLGTGKINHRELQRIVLETPTPP